MKLKSALLLSIVFCLLTTIPAFAADPTLGSNKTVLLDQFYNHQLKDGKQYHYIWTDTANSGLSKFGKVLTDDGAQITSLNTAPSADDLKKASIYIICCPTPTDAAPDKKPNFIAEPNITTIESWVKDGGTLLLLANDPSRCEFTHFNDLASRFGITFDGNLRNSAPKSADRPHATFLKERDQFPNQPLFDGLDATYMKEISSITIKPPAQPIFVVNKDPKESVKTDDGAGPTKDIIIAQAHVGKGLVLAIGDPWVYNEYFDKPKDWEKFSPGVPWNNNKAAQNLAKYLLQNSQPPQSK